MRIMKTSLSLQDLTVNAGGTIIFGNLRHFLSLFNFLQVLKQVSNTKKKIGNNYKCLPTCLCLGPNQNLLWQVKIL